MFKNMLLEPVKLTTAYMLGGITVLGVWALMNRQQLMHSGKCMMESMNMMNSDCKHNTTCHEANC